MCSRHKKGTQETEALGRSRGGFTTKLHARCDARGLPLGFVLTPGQTHDVQGFAPLFVTWLSKVLGVPVAPSFYVLFACLLTLLGTYCMQEAPRAKRSVELNLGVKP